MAEISDQALIDLKETMAVLLKKNEDAIEAIDALTSAVGYLAFIVNDIDTKKFQKFITGLKIMSKVETASEREQKADAGALKIISSVYQLNKFV